MLALACAVSAPACAAANWSAYVAEASARFGVPQSWIWRVIAIESRGRTTLNGRPIRSPKGAMGLMQLMPGTWAAMRDAYGLGPDPDDPRDNILAGAAYLRLMYDRFGYPGLFGAYNAGPARFLASLSGTPLPRETRDYMLSAAGKSNVAVPQPSSANTSLFAVTPRMTGPEPVGPGEPTSGSALLVPLGRN